MTGRRVERCETCRFSVGYDPDWIECRRYAPRPELVIEQDRVHVVVVAWPLLVRWSGCGEWQPQSGAQ